MSEITLKNAEKRLKKHKQQHLLRFWGLLDQSQKEQLIDQINRLDLPWINTWVEKYIKKNDAFKLPADLAPASYYPIEQDTPELKQKYKKASQVLEEALKIGKESNDMGIQANSLQKLGTILQDQKQYDNAASLYYQGLAICQQIGDIVGIATFINNLGAIDFSYKKYEIALQKYQEAFNLLNQVGLGESPLAHTILRNIDHLNLQSK